MSASFDLHSDLGFSQDLIAFASRNNLHGEFSIEELEKDSEHSLSPEVQNLLSLNSDKFELGRHLDRAVATRRLQELKAQKDSVRPDPYKHPSLKECHVEPGGMVELSEFTTREGAFTYGDTVFELLPTLDQRHSSYWSALSLRKLDSDLAVRIRLDPFMANTKKDYRGLFYRMFVFGRPLSWDQVLKLRDPSSHRWMPGNPDESEVAFTDCVWIPRDDEVHLRCEEVPKVYAASYRASRYFHAIVDCRKKMVTHCDGALRIFDDAEAEARVDLDIPRAGKLGTRVKVFQVDGDLASDSWAELFQAFFVWNYDVVRFAEELMSAN